MATNSSDVNSDSPTEWLNVPSPAATTPASSNTPIRGTVPRNLILPHSSERQIEGNTASKLIDESFEVSSLRKENDYLKRLVDIFNKKEAEFNRRIVELEVAIIRQKNELENTHAKQLADALKQKEDELRATFQHEKQQLLSEMQRRQNYRAS